MDMNQGPRSRGKKVSNQGSGVTGRRGEGLGTGPVNNTGSYQERKEQEHIPASSFQHGNEQTQHPFFGDRGQGAQQGMPISGNQSQRPQQSGPSYGSGAFFGNGRTQSRPQTHMPLQNRPSHEQGQSSAHTPGTKSTTQHQSAASRNGTSGCSSKLLLIVLAVIVIFGGGKLTGLFGSGTDTGTVPQQTNTQISIPASSNNVVSSSGIGDLLSAFLGSSGTSVYDTTDFSPFGSFMQNAGSATVSSTNTPELDRTVVSGAREKRTVLKGNGKDKVTVMVYMCGADLESRNGMGTADLKEMTNAKIGKNMNLIVFTGGCTNWKNNVVSSQNNQIYQIRDGGLFCLEKNMGTGSMTDPATLTKFLKYGKENFSANRMILIFWDHGGGSVSGFGCDEKYRNSGSMSLAGINSALGSAGMTFDFIGFDACLMATLENALMLEQYADYMIGSEETEPGVGWYYTNWLTKLSANTGMPTIEIGKIIADDFVDVCNQKCRGQATTLSVVDLAEVAKTVPKALKAFSESTNDMIRNNDYATVSKARGSSKEFAQSTGIDQVDLIHFANNVGTEESKKLAKALKGAVKYNRTGGGISNANGLSIYFPYRKNSKLRQAVSTYDAIGMDQEYTKCITEFAGLEVSGQIAAGTDAQHYSSNTIGLSSLMDSLLGNGSYYSQAGSSDTVSGLLGSLLGGSSGGMFDLFGGRSMSVQKTADYIVSNHFEPERLVWCNGKITLPQEQWKLVTDLCLNVFVDDGKGFIDLGTDNLFTKSGNDLIGDYDGTWISINGQPVPYYYMYAEDNGRKYLSYGYVPVLLNGQRANLILMIDEEGNAEITGAHYVYSDGVTETQAKTVISIGEGDKLDFICDYYDYNGNYQDSYRLGKQMTLGKQTVIENTPVGKMPKRVTYRFTDIYQQRYWTPVLP